MGRPRVSLCLLTYKRAQTLPRTIESLLAQSCSDFELLIHDDCSPDDTERVCRDYESRDPRVRYFRNRANLRYANNQNAAILRARCEYVGIVHDGDRYYPTMVERWIAALDAHPSAALVFNATDYMDRVGGIAGRFEHAYEPLISGLELLDEMLVWISSPIFGIVMVRKAHVLAAGPFDPRLPTLADIDMWMRLLLHHDVAYVKEPLFAIALREVDHHNSFANWSVRGEHELIYTLNWRRRFAEDPVAAERMRRRVARMLWKARAQQLAACVRYRKLEAFSEGLRFVRSQPPFGAAVASDRATDWETLRSTIL